MFKKILFTFIFLASIAGNILTYVSDCNIYAPIRQSLNDRITLWVDNQTEQKSPPISTVKEKKPPLKVAFNTWLGYSPLVWALENHFLEEEGVSVEISFLEGIAEKNSALIRGEIDAVGHTADSVITSTAAGVDGQIIYVFDKSFGADAILADSSIQTIKDLKGKQVAVEPGFTGHFFLLSLLKEAGLKEKDIKIVEMDTGSAGSTFVAGKIDAAVTWEPWIGKAKERKNAHILISSADRPGIIIDVLYMRKETIKNRKDDVDALIRAMGKATKWYLNNREKGNLNMGKFWKLSTQEVADTVSGIRFMTLEENYAFFGTKENPGQLLNTLNNANELWFSSGITRRLISDTNNLIYYSNTLIQNH